MSAWKKSIEWRLRNIDSNDIFKDQQVREIHSRLARLENRDRYAEEKLNVRIRIIEDSLSRIARTLDANHIKEACMHCGQTLPNEKDCC